jgi:hypothetical protein
MVLSVLGSDALYLGFEGFLTNRLLLNWRLLERGVEIKKRL